MRELDRPTDLRFPTLLERLNATGRTTGTVLSKEYLYGIFDGGRPTGGSRSPSSRSPATRRTPSRWTR